MMTNIWVLLQALSDLMVSFKSNVGSGRAGKISTMDIIDFAVIFAFSHSRLSDVIDNTSIGHCKFLISLLFGINHVFSHWVVEVGTPIIEGVCISCKRDFLPLGCQFLYT